jgi:hypothetical protein
MGFQNSIQGHCPQCPKFLSLGPTSQRFHLPVTSQAGDQVFYIWDLGIFYIQTITVCQINKQETDKLIAEISAKIFRGHVNYTLI